MPALHGCEFRCRKGNRCIRKSWVCDGFYDCSDGSDEISCDDDASLSKTGSRASTASHHHAKLSHRPRARQTTRSWYWSADDFDNLDDYLKDWSPPKITIPDTFTMPSFKMPTFKMPTGDDVTPPSYYSDSHGRDASAPLTAGGVVFGVFFLSVALAVCRLCCRRASTSRVLRIQTQHPSVSTQALIAPERIATDRGDGQPSNRVVGRILLRQATDERDRGARRILIRARSTNDLRSENGQQTTSSGGRPGASQQPQQQQQGGDGGEPAQRTTEALHLMVRDGPWLTTRTLRPMIPDQPNIPLFIEQSNVRRLDDSRGIVVSTPPQLMMYVDGEFVFIPASRVPEALNFIALLNLQTEEGPSPAAPEHIQDLPTVSIQQETVDTGGRCNVCLEDFGIDEQVRELPCRHLYHSDCIVPWLQLNGTCPACREPISGEQQTDNTTDAADATNHTDQ